MANKVNYKSNDMGKYPVITKWSESAVECYKRGCNCKGCFYEDFFSKPKYSENEQKQKCQMKATVLELVKVLGVPDGVKEITVIKDEIKNIGD